MINVEKLNENELKSFDYFAKLRGRNYNVVYNFPNEFSIDSIKAVFLPTIYQLFNLSCPNVAIILHDKDTKDDGTLKTPHLHIVLHYESRVYGTLILSTIQQVIGTYFNVNQVTCEYCNNIRGSIRYLIHKDDTNKYQYSINNIFSNFDIECYFEDIKNVTIEIIENVCLSSKKLLDVYKSLGIKYTKQYFQVINMVWELTQRERNLNINVDEYGEIENVK